MHGAAAAIFAVGVLVLAAVPGAVQARQAAQDGVQVPTVVTQDYRIGPRDLLEIRVFGVDELDTSVRVSEGGTISFPLVGELVAAGLT